MKNQGRSLHLIRLRRDIRYVAIKDAKSLHEHLPTYDRATDLPSFSMSIVPILLRINHLLH